MTDYEYFINIVGNSYSRYYKSIWDNYINKKYFGWNWPAFFFSPMWWFYRKLYCEAFLYIFAILSVNIIIENILILVNTYNIIYKILKCFMILLILIFSSKAANYRYFLKISKLQKRAKSEKQCKRYRNTQFLSLLLGIVIIPTIFMGFDYLLEYNKIYPFKNKTFINLLLVNDKNDLMKEINNLGGLQEQEGDFNIYQLQYKGNDVSIIEIEQTINITIEYKEKSSFNEEILPLMFLGKIRYADLDYKWKSICGRSVSFLLEEDKIVILMSIKI